MPTKATDAAAPAKSAAISAPVLASPFESFAVDAARSTEGVMFHLNGFRLLVARMGSQNEALQAVTLRKMRQFGLSQEDLESGTSDLGEQASAEIMAEAVLLGWETKVGDEWKGFIVGPGGVHLEPSLKNRILVLTELPELAQRVLRFAKDHRNFLKKTLEATAEK